MYTLEFDKERVLDYLRNLDDLSRGARVKLFASLHLDLRVHGDHYIADSTRRFPPGSEYFWYDLLILDDEGDGRVHRFWFVVSDRSAQYGVLKVAYVQNA